MRRLPERVGSTAFNGSPEAGANRAVLRFAHDDKQTYMQVLRLRLLRD
jgi:hypothetical protein